MIVAGLRKLAPEVEREAKRMPILSDILDHEVLGREYKRGREEGLRTGQIELLRLQLENRFGRLPQWAEDRLGHASAGDLETIARRLLSVNSLAELLS
jgi:hypothetical protein